MNLNSKDFGFEGHGHPPSVAAPSPRRIEFALAVIFVFLAPINLLRVDAFYFTASDAFAVAALFAMVLNRSFSLTPLGPVTLAWNGGIALLAITLLFSSLLHGEPSRGFILAGQYLFAYLLLGHVILSRPWREIVQLLKAFVISIGVMCIHAIYVVEIVAQTNTQFVSGNGRLLGFVERENECAAVIALAVPLLLVLVGTGHVRARWLCVALPLFAYGIALTGSNTGLLALVYAIAAFVFVAGSWKQIALAGLASFAVFSSVVTWGRDFLPTAFQNRVLGALESGQIAEAGTFDDRVQLIYEAIGKAEHAMLLGIGADQYRVVSGYGAPVHNMYLLLWVEAGFFGMAGFVLMMIGAILAAIMAFRARGGRIAAVCTLTMVTLFALLVNALPHTYGRFLVVPLLLGIAPSIVAVRDSRVQIRKTRLSTHGRRFGKGRSRGYALE